MDSRLRGNDGERFARPHDYVVSDLSLSFLRRWKSIGHHSDPHWGSFLESTESSMPGSIFSGASKITNDKNKATDDRCILVSECTCLITQHTQLPVRLRSQTALILELK